MASQKLLQFEQEIGQLLMDKLEHLEITPERASQIAQFVLERLPENLTDEQVENIVPTLDNRFFELAEIVYNHLEPYEDGNEKKTELSAEELIKQGKIDEASKLMEDFFKNEHL